MHSHWKQISASIAIPWGYDNWKQVITYNAGVLLMCHWLPPGKSMPSRINANTILKLISNQLQPFPVSIIQSNGYLTVLGTEDCTFDFMGVESRREQEARLMWSWIKRQELTVFGGHTVKLLWKLLGVGNRFTHCSCPICNNGYACWGYLGTVRYGVILVIGETHFWSTMVQISVWVAHAAGWGGVVSTTGWFVWTALLSA